MSGRRSELLPCGCIVVLLCWVVVLMSLAFWIFGLPLWLQDVWGWWNGADHKNATGTPGMNVSDFAYSPKVLGADQINSSDYLIINY